jgi:dTDP-4-amino-4,6-dideoxy-D-galactose acyltransferase
MIRMNEVCKRLDWDSAFFGVTVGRVSVDRLTPELVAEIDAWCAAESIDCLYFLADPSDHQTAWLADQHGFLYVDTRVLWAVTLTEAPEAWRSIRLATPADLLALKPIARSNHRDSRFYFDPVFPEERADALYEAWIENSVSGKLAEAVLVVTDESDQAVGYSAVQVTERGAVMTLLGVSESARGRGLGTQLTRASFRYCWERGIRTIELPTQGRNLAAQRLYVKHGFLPIAVNNWYHRWTPAMLTARGKQR